MKSLQNNMPTIGTANPLVMLVRHDFHLSRRMTEIEGHQIQTSCAVGIVKVFDQVGTDTTASPWVHGLPLLYIHLTPRRVLLE